MSAFGSRRLVSLAASLLGCYLAVVVPAEAHTLGVDKAELVELAPGHYRLVSKVPVRLQPLITTPELPERCTLAEPQRGERGAYVVRFTFACDAPLTADDRLILPWQREGALFTVTWLGQEPITKLAIRDGDKIVVEMADYLAGSGSIWRAASRYTLLGFEHILEGLDHLLFVLALMIVVRHGWQLVKTITAFTVAHSITLGLATLGYINLPSAPVEAAIALSIVFLCVEILHARRGITGVTYAAPWIVAFSFGLLHGLGFAGALSEIGLPPSEIPIALLFFNIGVELGQLAFVGVVLAGLWVLSRLRISWPAWVELASAYAIGTVATYWFIERAAGIFMPA